MHTIIIMDEAMCAFCFPFLLLLSGSFFYDFPRSSEDKLIPRKDISFGGQNCMSLFECHAVLPGSVLDVSICLFCEDFVHM